ncbi:PREDICTED: V-set and immunoglobulin domain-containing protein 8 [Nanorana parkeri]|uniref:V-set and immunoglobulin domain-containing protein 8 n=1 Tax=Nanorana parkeri TaxID=125878 RepID=UPI0008540A8A|nr:PREDICTED: V-set and immunoglobulin domain-containing protein 8 [Nanorana parkeri]
MTNLWGATLIVLGLMPAWLGAITIQEPSTESITKAKGDTVTLGCTYTVDASETGNLDIEWAKMNPDSSGLDTVILTYMDNQIVSKGPSTLMSRLTFKQADPSKGDAAIIITYLDVVDTAIYQCKVKKINGLGSRKISLGIQVLPSPPRCSIEGDQSKGKDVTLKCRSDEGSPPLSYVWKKIAGPANPAVPVLNLRPLNGDLLIKNISEVYAGEYQCTVTNMVGSGTCVADLAVASANRTGIIIGAVLGALLLLLLLLLLIWCLICCCNKRRYEKEIANDIREDVIAPPPSNTNSRASSVRTAAGYRAHNISYSLRKIYNAAPRHEPTAPSLSGSEPTKVKFESPASTPEPIRVIPSTTQYNPYNIQRVGGGVPVMVPAHSREGFIV